MEFSTNKEPIKLKELMPEEEKKVVKPEKIQEIFNHRFGERMQGFKTVNLSYLNYYYYNCESINDFNWGCAWRSMQTCLDYELNKSSTNKKHDKNIGFKNLFNSFCQRNVLINLWKKMKGIEEIPGFFNKEIFPCENGCGWAEPFISQLVLFSYGFKGDLILINDYNKCNYAPREVFKDTKDFIWLQVFLNNYFEDENNKGPIIIDDSRISCCIIGAKLLPDSIELLIMDPHIISDVEEGIYIVKLSKEGECKDIYPKERVLRTSRCIFFNNNKPWMFFIPKNN